MIVLVGQNALRPEVEAKELVIEAVPGEPLALRIRDDGRGIPKGLEARLFEPFEGGGEGPGLGLHLAERIGRRIGVRLELEAAPKGTCFRLCFGAEAPGGAGPAPP